MAARSTSARPHERGPPSTPRPSRQRPYFRDAAGRRLETAPRGFLERAAHEEAGGERVTCSGRVDDVGVHGGEVELRVLGKHGAATRAAFEHADRCGQV